MKRIRNVGLAVVAAVALSAGVGVAGASAANFEAEYYPATISSSNPYGNHYWHFHEYDTYCGAPAVGGTLNAPGSALEATAGEASCNAFFQIGTEMKMNGCKLIYRPGAETAPGTFKGTVDIGPTGCGPITFRGGSNPSARCMVDVPAQKGLSATYENLGAGSLSTVKVSINTGNIKYNQVSGKCALGSYSNGTWTGSWQIQASNKFGSVGLQVKGSGGFELPPGGIGINPVSRTLEAGIYPTTVTGQQNEGGQHALAVAAGSLKCSTVKFNSTLAAAAKQISVQPEYGGCTAFGFPATVKTNGCTYTLSVLNQAPVGSTFAGHTDIACPVGKAIEVVAISGGVTTKCTVSIPAQTTDSGGLSLTNESATSTIGLAFSVKGIDYKQAAGSGLGACASTEGTTGTYAGSSTLVGSY